jgi:hypothetical protein
MIPKRMRPMHRQVLLLVMAQAFAQTASILVMTVGSLAGREIAPAPQLATVPISAMILGTVAATVPASMWMARAGRRVGFVTGALLGALGGLVAASGIAVRSFFVLLLGLFLIGTYQALRCSIASPQPKGPTTPFAHERSRWCSRVAWPQLCSALHSPD